jgi:AcrR family transcriptional regulator
MSEKTPYHHGDLKNALIEAGIEILSKEGPGALSLRSVARRAGVSHAAPYAHFTDKQALVAAISTEGYRKLYERVAQAAARHADDPLRQFAESSWAYVAFALDEPAHFKITLSGVVEKERDYPAFVEIAQKNYASLLEIVTTSQAAGILDPGPPDLMAVSVWGLIHGFTTLILEGQLSHALLERYSIREMFIFALNQIARVRLDPALFPLE